MHVSFIFRACSISFHFYFLVFGIYEEGEGMIRESWRKGGRRSKIINRNSNHLLSCIFLHLSLPQTEHGPNRIRIKLINIRPNWIISFRDDRVLGR